MIHTIKEFLKTYGQESAITSRVMAALTDASLAQRVSAEDRTLGEIAWHLATSVPEMANHTGLEVPGAADAAVPASAAAIREAYGQAAAGLLEQVGGRWTDETLAVKDDMYGEMWRRSFTLTVLIVHEIHHRGQMSVLMRQAGLAVPEIYGPNREQTEAMRG
ncbi:MAG: DinB family protein [Acidobacteriota bacterium]